MRFEKIVSRFQPPGEILFVAIQVCEDVARGTAISPINRVIHPGVFFNEGADTPIFGQPILCVVVRTGVLNDMFDLNTLLISHGGDTEFEPLRVAKTRRNDRENHSFF